MTTLEDIRRRLTQPIGGSPNASTPPSAPEQEVEPRQERRPASGGRRASLNRQRTQVGLDIGSSAVRAVELAFGRGRTASVLRFGQVGLPKGAVVEGEVADADAVGKAIRTLWTQAGFTTTSVVVGVSSQRVMVREADVPAMSESDFRQALNFEAADLIPIPVDDAAMDFRIVDPALATAGNGHAQMRILLAAAHKSTIDAHLTAVRLGGLSPTAIGVGGLALVRSLNLGDSDVEGAQAVVDVGADITTVAVASGGELRFVRVLAGGGSSYTQLLEADGDLLEGEAEKQKRTGAVPAGGLPDEDPLVSQITTTLEYFASQGGSGGLRQVVVSGGGSRYQPFMARLAERLPWEVARAAPPSGLAELDGMDTARAEAVVQTATGLAAWRGRADGTRINLLPGEITAARRERRVVAAMVAAGVALAVVLAGAWYSQHHQIGGVQRQTAAVIAASAVEQGAVTRLEPVSAYEQAVKARDVVVRSTETGDVDVHGLLSAIAAHLPKDLSLTNIQITETGSSAGTSASSTGTSAPPTTTSSSAAGGATDVIGTVSMSLSGKGSTAVAAAFLRSMAAFPVLSDVVVPSESAQGGNVTFSATANLTNKAPMTAQKGS